MNIIRWIAGIFASVIVAIIGTPIINLIFKFLITLIGVGDFGRTGWVYIPSEFGNDLTFFNFEIIPFCISVVIAYGLGGLCACKIIKPHKKVFYWIGGSIISIVSIIVGIFLCSGEHWFFSTIIILALIIGCINYVVLGTDFE